LRVKVPLQTEEGLVDFLRPAAEISNGICESVVLLEPKRSRLHSNPVEFDGIKTGVVDLLPEAEELKCVAVAQPVANQVVAGGPVLVAGGAMSLRAVDW
jgi:hypothetical protein